MKLPLGVRRLAAALHFAQVHRTEFVRWKSLAVPPLRLRAWRRTGRQQAPALRGLALTAIAVACLATPANSQPETPKGTRVIMLGTGTPNAVPERSGPATAIQVNGEVYLFDCGPGIVRRAAAAGLPMTALKRVFLTHLHSDHTLGLPDLIFSPWTLGRTAPLEVYGPPGTAAMTRNILAAWAEDIRIRVDGLEPANTTGYKASARDIQPGVAYKDSSVTVRAFAVPHGQWEHAYGYRIETPDKVIVISGDTTRSDEILNQSRGADILIHEVYSDAAWAKRPAAWQKYHAAFHTSASDLARIAAQAKPKLLVIYHYLLWGDPEEQLLGEIRAIYSGPVVIAKDLQVF